MRWTVPAGPNTRPRGTVRQCPYPPLMEWFLPTRASRHVQPKRGRAGAAPTAASFSLVGQDRVKKPHRLLDPPSPARPCHAVPGPQQRGRPEGAIRTGRADDPQGAIRTRHERTFEFDGCSPLGHGPVRGICAVGLRSGVTLWLEKEQGDDSRSGAARVLRPPGIDGQALPPRRRPSISAQLMGDHRPRQAALPEAGSRFPLRIAHHAGSVPWPKLPPATTTPCLVGNPSTDGGRQPRLGPNCRQLHHG